MKNVVSFFNCSKENDTFYDVTIIAAKIAKAHPDKKILMVHRGNSIVPGRRYNLDFDRFNSIQIEIKGLWNLHAFYMGENKELALLHPDQAEFFIKKIAEQFDLVICDAGDDICNPFTLGTLFASGNVIYLVNGLKSSLARYLSLEPLLKKLSIPTSAIFVDFGAHEQRYSPDYLFDTLGDEAVSKLFFGYSKTDNDLGSLACFITNRLFWNMPKIRANEEWGER